MKNVLKKIEGYRKFVVALVVNNVAAILLVSTADFSTKQGIIAFVIAELGAFGIYKVPNTTKPSA